MKSISNHTPQVFILTLNSSSVIVRPHMARICEITGKGSQMGGGYSNRVRATKFNPTGKRRRHVNMQTKTLFIPEIGKKITVRVSAKGLKTMKKRGAFKTLQKAGMI